MTQSAGQIFATAHAVVVSIAQEEGGSIVTAITPNQTHLRLRLFGIDIPESPRRTICPGQPYSPEARALLQRLLQGQRILVEIHGVDHAKRLLSTLLVGAQNVNLALVEAGFAEVRRDPDVSNPYQTQYEAAEAAARAACHGMWSLGEQYESPRDYRHRVRIRE